MIRAFIIAAVITAGAATANAQCSNCQPSGTPIPGAPTAQDAHDAPQYVWVRRGLFGCRWRLMRVYPYPAKGQVLGVVKR